MIDTTFDLERCKTAISKLNKTKAADIYRKYFSGKNKVGCCSDLFDKLQPSTWYDFSEKVNDYASKNKYLKIKDRGLTYDERIKVAEEYMDSVNKHFPNEYHFTLQDYYDAIIGHVFYETVKGKFAERALIDVLKNKYNINATTPKDKEIDSFYGIDIYINKDIGIQVKPVTFFKSKEGHTMKDNEGLIEKHFKAIKKLGTITYYVFYRYIEKDNVFEFVVRDNGKLTYKLDELYTYTLNDNGDVIDCFRNRVKFSNYVKSNDIALRFNKIIEKKV